MSMKGLALAVASIVLIACNGDSEVASEPTAASQSSPPPVATTAPAPSPTPSPAPESAPAFDSVDYESRLSGLEDAFHAMVDSYNETLRPHYEGYLAEIELAESTYDEGLAAAAAVEKADVAIINRDIASGPLRSRLAQLRHNLVEGQDYPMVYIGEAAEAHVLALKTALEIYKGQVADIRMDHRERLVRLHLRTSGLSAELLDAGQDWVDVNGRRLAFIVEELDKFDVHLQEPAVRPEYSEYVQSLMVRLESNRQALNVLLSADEGLVRTDVFLGCSGTISAESEIVFQSDCFGVGTHALWYWNQLEMAGSGVNAAEFQSAQILERLSLLGWIGADGAPKFTAIASQSIT